MSTPSNADLRARDIAHVWHPCTQMKDHEREMPLLPIRRGAGAWLEDYDGRRYLDAISSWWVNLFGHANPRINAAVAAQLEALPHVMFAGFTHEPALQLAERLTALAPPGLNRCFFADSGSAAIEIAVKMSYHYWQNRGRPRKTRFVTLANSYHGETLGALAVGSVELYKAIYRPLLMDVITAPSPDAFLCEAGESAADCARRQFAALERILAEGADEIAAVLVEPLVQCAGNMRMYDPVYLTLLREACDRHGVHLIADEIAVGFGRTGTMFACEQAAVRPDFMCLSKGLTGGYLPMSVVLTTDEVYDAFYDEYAKLNAFLHSHSYSGNPLACAAALATLAIFADDDVLARNRALAARLGAAARTLADHPNVAEVRQLGMIVAVEFVRDRATRETFPWRERRHLRIHRHALERGVLLRPLGNVVYFMPPYVVTPAEIELMVTVAREGLDLAARD
jgi:adenosylmethionine-8-amino-7-oxononanoate aminotransferase